MTAEEKLAEVEHAAIRSQEEGVPLSPLLVLAIVRREGGRGWAPPVHLSHDLPRTAEAG